MKKGGLISIAFIALIFLGGCEVLFGTKAERQNKRANRRLERLIKKHPNLIQKDTIKDTVEVIVPEIKIDTNIVINKDVSGVDSVLNKFEGKLDSLTRLKLGDEIKYYITKRSVLTDTLNYVEDDITVNVWQEGDLIRVKVNKPEQVIKKETETVVDTIKPVEEKKWYDKPRTILWFLICSAIVFVAYKFLHLLKK